MNLQAIILSGGKGTRLYPLTKDTPKPMLPIKGIPHLEYQIRLLKSHGIKDVIFSTGYLHEQIEGYFGTGINFDINLRYREDGDMLLGTAGALRNCLDLIKSDSILVLNGDILTDINLSGLMETHKQSKMPITMTLIDVPDPSGFGIVQYQQATGKVTAFIEKPEIGHSYGNTINAGIYAINREVLYSIPEDEFSMLEKDLFPKFVGSNMVQAYVCNHASSYWLDIGTLPRYQKAELDMGTHVFI